MTNLTDRMRTCAAYIMGTPREEENILLDDAAKLLVEGAHEIDVLIGSVVPGHSVPGMGDPMEIIEPPVVTPPPVVAQTSAMWIGDDLRPIPNAPKNLNACPKCDSRATKTVRKRGKSLWLVCPVCEHAWTR
jgi:hypothetical protein